ALQLQAQGLHQLSPLSTLNRGYALVSAPDGALIRKISQVKEKQALKVRLSDGSFDCQVTQKPMKAEPCAD
ncbi:MAG: exodeoxyribonuclease VII large subunit, partial [Gammaproteobacteria bacterium]